MPPILSRVSRSLAVFALVASSSCLTYHDSRVVPLETLLPWLQQGVTTRSALIEALGAPRQRLESGRVMFWEIGEDGRPTTWRRPEDPFFGPFSLVVVLAGDLVQRASLVRTWE